MLATNWI